jgi:hypothetical protein
MSERPEELIEDEKRVAHGSRVSQVKQDLKSDFT